MQRPMHSPPLIALDPRRLSEALEAEGKLLRVRREVDPHFDLAAVIRAIQKGPNLPVLFETVKGSRFPVLSNVLGSYDLVATMIGAEPTRLAQRWATLLNRSTAEIAENFIEEPGDFEEITLLDLPQIVFSEKDGGPYITAGIIAVKDPETGIQNLSYHRSQIISADELRCRLSTSGDLFRIQQAAEKRGQHLPVVMLIGVPPAIMLASATSYGPTINELDIAERLAGGRFAVQRVDSADVDVPMATQFVIEGEILAGVRRPEGPYGDWLEYYVPVTDNHVLKVNRILARKDAIYYAVFSASTEEITTSGVPISGGIYQAIHAWVPTVRDVCCYPAMQFCIVQMAKRYEGEPRKAMLAAFGAELVRTLYCVVVDEDVDIHDPADVIWAISTRCRPDRDIFQIPEVPSSARDAHQSYWGRLGMDATKPLEWSDEFERKVAPGSSSIRLEDYLG